MRNISVHNFGHRLGTYIAAKTCPGQAQLLGYGAEILLGSMFKITILFLTAALLDIVYEVGILLLVTGLLRTFSGGAHCTAYYRCVLTSVTVLTVTGYALKTTLPFLIALPNWVLIIVLAVSIYLYSRHAPQAPFNKPLKGREQEAKFRRLTLISAASLSIISITLGTGAMVSWMVALGLWWQAFTLTPSGHLLIGMLDKLLLLIFAGKGGEAECGSQ